MIRSGTTCFNDMYYLPEETAAIVNSIGMRAVIGLMGRDKKGTQNHVNFISFNFIIFIILGRNYVEENQSSILSHSLRNRSPLPLSLRRESIE